MTAVARREPDELVELVALSRAAGADPDWVQGGGGNTSIKSGDGRSMWVKTSGVALRAIDTTHGFAEVDLPAVRALLDEPGIAALPVHEREREVLARLRAAVRAPAGARPSVESSLHALLDRVVLHTHAVHWIAFLCARESRERWRELLGELAGDALYVPYVDPGFTLAARLRDDVAAHARATGRRPAIVLLENHGLIVAADTVEKCLELQERVAAIARRWAGGKRVNPVRFELLRVDAASGDAEYPICANDVAAFASGGRGDGDDARGAAARVRAALLAGGARPVLVRADDSPTALALLRSEAALCELAAGGAFTPDQIAYCRTWPLLLEGAGEGWPDAVRAYRERHGLDPKVVLAHGLGVFHAAPDLAELRVVAETHRLAMNALLRSAAAGGPRFLDRRQASFIEEWEVERFRTELLSGASSLHTGRVVLVADGPDRESCDAGRALLEAGATVVVLVAPDAEPARPPPLAPLARWLILRASAADRASARRVLRVVESSLGGIDFVIAAAGAPALESVGPELATRSGGRLLEPAAALELSAGRRATP